MLFYNLFNYLNTKFSVLTRNYSSGAPYKNAAVLMSMESSKAAEATQAGGSCNLDEVAENIIREKWSAIGQVLVREDGGDIRL